MIDELHKLNNISLNLKKIIDDMNIQAERLEFELKTKDTEIGRLEQRIKELIDIIHKYDSNTSLELKKWIIRVPPGDSIL
uniref:Uncharacterized protein n=1 Tax=viral metagenome TaxID=1070528 RepID=A0A6M3MEC8_9ZZZZ